MRTRLVFGAMAMAMAWPAAAHATDYGGGTVPESVSRSARQLTLVGIRTNDTGGARITIALSARCGVARLLHTVQLNPDGTFAFEVPVRNRVRDDRRVRQRARIAMSGQVVGAAASGTASARIVQRRGGRVVGRCRSGARPWQVRAAVAEPTVAGPQPSGAYHGLTSQSGRPFPFLLRVSPDARRVRTAIFDYRQRCRKSRFEWDNITPSAPVASDGSFRLRERFTHRWADGPERYRVKVDGRFTTTGVSGTLSVSSVFRSSSGRVLDRCRTGQVAFAALL